MSQTQSENPIRVIVVDDHPLFREGVARALSESPGLTVVAEGGSSAEAIALAEEFDPDVIMLDLSMPGGGLNALSSILEGSPEAKAMVLTVSESDDDVFAALRAGALGYVLKGIGANMLVNVVRGIAVGESYVSPALAARILAEMQTGGVRSTAEPEAIDPLSTLSPREEQILQLVAEGNSNKEVGRSLGLQDKTIKHHMTRILQKLHVRNRTEAAILLKSGGSR